jgi:two-component system sensor histidine kinase VicK
MDYFQRLLRTTRINLFIVFFLDNLLLFGSWWLGSKILKLNGVELLGLISAVALIETTIIASQLTKYLIQPVKALWQAVMHLTPEPNNTAAPKIDQLSYGRELVSTVTTQLYQLISSADKLKAENDKVNKDLNHNFIAHNLPLPLIILDNSETIKFANQQAADYIGIAAKDLLGKNVYMVLDMSFPSEDTFDNWLKGVKHSSATATRCWERVKLPIRDSHPLRLFDLAAYYNKENPDNNETLLVLFDHTKQYSQDEQAISFLAVSVHELRAPLTLLRGYIEVLEEELKGKIDEETQNFLEKMHAQAEQLMAFVNNILNVARIDDDQLELRLEEADWVKVLTSAVESLSLRAKIRGISLSCHFADDLPPVGVDQLSIKEVINNLVDNAIKYSNKGKVINIETHLTSEGLIETTIQDFGLGIPTSSIPNLFTKFYRDHHNRAQIGGTGLGLYLAKAIIKAHGGNLWVSSHEGEGSIFGFTLMPYSQISDEAKATGNQEVTRSAHGWIKNHSLYRR